MKKPPRKRPVRPVAPLALALALGVVPLALAAVPSPDGTGQAPPAGEPRIRFNFKGQSYDQILDYFSRVTGYPVVREAPVPAGTVDYLYPGE